MKAKASGRAYASIWDAIEDTPAAAANMKLRSALMMALARHIEREKLTQKEAAKAFGVTQPRISDLVRGKIDLFGLDTLVNMASAAGLRVDMKLKKAA
nr:XRE family transcriptional regulator [Aerococcus urinae]